MADVVAADHVLAHRHGHCGRAEAQTCSTTMPAAPSRRVVAREHSRQPRRGCTPPGRDQVKLPRSTSSLQQQALAIAVVAGVRLHVDKEWR